MGVFTEFTYLNFMRSFFEVGNNFRSQSDTQTRGGPLMENPSSFWVVGGLFSNYNSPNRWGPQRDRGLGVPHRP